MKFLSQNKIDKLKKLGDQYNCPIYLPPFLGRHNPFLDVSKISHDAVKIMHLQELVEEAIGCDYEIHFVGKKRFMEITPK